MVRRLLGSLFVFALAPLTLAQPLTSLENLPEQRWIYKPSSGRLVAPAELGLGVQDCYFQASDGVKLNAWFMPAAPGQPTLLYFHGNGGSLSFMQSTFRHMSQAGFGALVVDYRGYGLSQGRPSEQGLYRDGLAAYRFLMQKGVRPDRLLIHGQSLGGGVATYVASRRACAGLILESTFSSFPAIAAKVCGGGWKGRLAGGLVRTQFPNQQRLASIRVPVLVIHGKADELIPWTMGQALYGALPQGRGRAWWVAGAGHNNLRAVAGAEYARRLRLFWATLR